MGVRQAIGRALAPREPPILTDQQHGEISSWCLTRDTEWINRRVERIELVDDETIRRQVSVDFTLPPWLADEGATVYVPVAVLRKQPLTNFDVWQEDGSTLPVLNTARNGSISAWALKSLARREAAALDADIRGPKQLDALLDTVANKPAAPARGARTELRQRYPRLMAAGTPLRTITEVLADGFQLLVPVDMRPHTTRVIKFRYDEAIDWRGSDFPSRVFSTVFRGPFEFVGWWPKRWDLSLQSLDRGQGYRLEAVAPAELDIYDAVIKRRTPATRRDLTIAEGGGKERVHLVPERGHRQGRNRLTVKLRPQRRGVLMAYTATALLAAGELLLGRPHVREIEPQTGAALLLLLPTLIAAFLIRPGEHTFASRMLAGVRVLTVVAALSPLLAAGALAIYGTPRAGETATARSARLDHIEHLWTIGTWSACVSGSVLLVAYLFGARYPSAAGRFVARKLRKRTASPITR